MNCSSSRARWRRCLKGVALVALLTTATAVLGTNNAPPTRAAEMVGTRGVSPEPTTGTSNNLPKKPPGLDDASWASLQQAIGKAATQQARLSGGSVAMADGAQGDQFGYSVAIDGDTAMVGAPFDDVGANTDQGSVYVFTRSEATWTLQAKLTASDGGPNDRFGHAVALHGDTALAGAVLDDVAAKADQGSAYVFTRSGTAWSQQAQLTADDGAAGDQFGHSVALAGDMVLVGSIAHDVGASSDQGAAYVFSRSGTTWTQQAHLTASDGAASDFFGFSVALDGDTALVASPFDDVGANGDQGSAYVFTLSGTTWMEQAQLTASDGTAGDQFGFSVALDEDTALVGAYADDAGANTDQGSAYVFARSGTTWVQQAQLTASDGAASDWFGWSVSLSTDTALVGTRLDDVGANDNQGSAYIFTRSGTTWTQQAKLTAGDGAPNDQFGWSIALDGDTVLVGAYFDDVGANIDQGSAYIFTRASATWTQQSKLAAGDGTVGDRFGYSVVLDGETALVGAPYDRVGVNTDQGSAYVFTRSGATWTQQAKLTASDGRALARFGYSVALDGDTALLAAPFDRVNANGQGSVYVFIRHGATWSQQAKLTASDGAFFDQLGYSVALDGDTALLGANADDEGANTNQGAAYVFTRSGSTWTQQAKLTAPDGEAEDQFGISVALDGGTALVGAYLDRVGATSRQGSAYVYVRSGIAWTQQTQLTANDGRGNDQFGISVALSGGTALVGAHLNDAGTSDQGSAYVFTRDGTVWTQQAKLLADDSTNNARFGHSVALNGNSALVGAHLDDVRAKTDQGSAYVFTRRGTTWTQQIKLTAADGAAGDRFGQSIALSNGTALVGANLAAGLPPFGNPNEGAVYVYTDVGLLAQTITFANPGAQIFGTSPTLAATASSGLAVTFSSATTNVCTISASGVLNFLQAGTCTIDANQTGNSTYDTAPQVSRSFMVTPTVPGAPTMVLATAGDGQATVTFSSPASNGGVPITGYTVTSNPGGITGNGVASPISVTGLINGQAYTFTVTATNSEGTGVESESSNPVTPRRPQAALTAIATPSTLALGETSSLSTSGGSGDGTVSYEVTSGISSCSVNSNILTATGVGTCTVTATKGGDSQFNPATAQVTVVVQAATDLEISKDDGTQYALPQGTVLYEILVANAGPLGVEGARLRDVLPAGLADALWTCTPLQLASCPQPAGEGGIDQTLTLPVNGVLRYRLSARVTAPLGSTLTNTATIDAPTGVIELQPTDNSASDSNLVVPEGLFGNGFEAAPNRISVEVSTR